MGSEMCIRDRNSVLLSRRAINRIWTPDLHIWNRTSSQNDERILLMGSKILSSEKRSELNEKIGEGDQHSKTGIELRYEIKTTVFCTFDYSAYPMDIQRCNITFGSGCSGAIFVLNEMHHEQHPTNTYEAANFDISIWYYDGKTSQNNNNVAIEIELRRMTASFILKYYIPCMAIVLVSIISFIIPVSVTVDVGRVSLLVTLFLTLITLFISHMVI